MKKMWFAVLALFVLVVLAGCQVSDDLSFNVQVIDLSGTVLLDENIIFTEDDGVSVVDLIDEAVDLDYSTSDDGTFVNGVASHYPTEYGVTQNYYFALYVDDELSSVGLDDLVLEDGMTISFIEETILSEFDVEVVDLDGTVMSLTSIAFNPYESIDIVELIDEKVGLDYSTSTYGTFVNGVGDFYPTEYGVTYNYYLSIHINGEASSVGLDDITLQDGMKLSFVETTMLDNIDRQVDLLIQSWLDSYSDTYINYQVFEYHVLAAIRQLNIYGYPSPLLTPSTISFPTESLARDTIANTFKTSIFETALGLNLDTTKTVLSLFEANNTYDACSLLTALTVTESSQTQIDSVLNSLIATAGQEPYMDADYAGMVLLALAQYKDNPSTTDTIEVMINYIQTTLTSDGVEAYGNANASSTAAVVLGLVAQGINPRGEDYTTDGTDLIEALIRYELFSSYKWLLTDEQADMTFSTPQVFSALVAYKIYRDVWGNPAFDLFGF